MKFMESREHRQAMFNEMMSKRRRVNFEDDDAEMVLESKKD